MSNKVYKFIDSKLKATILYKDENKWKPCGEGITSPYAICTNCGDGFHETTLDVGKLMFGLNFAQSHYPDDDWPLLKVELKGEISSEDEHVLSPVTIIYNNCEVLSYDGDTLRLKSSSNENTIDID